MSESRFDSLIDWRYHPQMIMVLGFAGCLFANLQDGGPFWAALIAAAVMTLPACLLLFIPYAVSVWVLAVLLLLPQAIRLMLRRPASTAR